MGWFSRNKDIEDVRKKIDEEVAKKIGEVVGYNSNGEISASSSSGGGTWGQAYVINFDGEKNDGEIGPVLDYRMNFRALAMRSWQSFMDSDITKTIMKKFTLWIIDKGLKLKSEPISVILELEGISLQTEKFNEVVEARFGLWAKSKRASYSGMKTFNEIAQEAFKSAKIGGDVLVVQRYNNKTKQISIELIDTCNLSHPVGYICPSENKIMDGVEINRLTKKHVAFHVLCEGKFERIPAENSAGYKVAFLVYGDAYRINSHRGVPLIATSLETLKKIERYKEAAVGSAEERQKIVYYSKHEIGSTGESPLSALVAKSFNADGQSLGKTPMDSNGRVFGDSVALSQNKTTMNLTPGADLKSLESKQEMFFKEFYETNAHIVCAAIGIPPNVAFSIYNDSFSASRAATKDWEHTMTVERDNFSTQFYLPIYQFFIFINVMNGKIDAPGFLSAYASKNYDVTESYTSARFTGPMFPHIDPLKEANAERVKLGELGKNIPLTTVERSVEILDGGDSDSNMEQFSEEFKYMTELGLDTGTSATTTNTNG